MKAWDELIVPSEPENWEPGSDKTTWDYVGLLQQTIRDLAKTANEHESVSQNLAEANVRQSHIISKLRAEITGLRVKVKDLTVAKES